MPTTMVVNYEMTSKINLKSYMSFYWGVCSCFRNNSFLYLIAFIISNMLHNMWPFHHKGFLPRVPIEFEKFAGINKNIVSPITEKAILVEHIYNLFSFQKRWRPQHFSKFLEIVVVYELQPQAHQLLLHIDLLKYVRALTISLWLTQPHLFNFLKYTFTSSLPQYPNY